MGATDQVRSGMEATEEWKELLVSMGTVMWAKCDPRPRCVKVCTA